MITHETIILAAPGLPDDGSLDALLSEIADLEARCAHNYFVEQHVKGRDWNELKSELSRRFGLTHRPFSSLASRVDGLAKGVRGYGGRGNPSRGALAASTAMQERSSRQPAKPLAGSRHRATAIDDRSW